MPRSGTIVAITGRPGVGKSTVLRRVIEELKRRGFSIGGILCPDVRGPDGRRLGFKIVDVRSGETAWLAVAGEPGEPRIGRYHVRVEEAERLGVRALRDAIRACDIIVIDEIGPMELMSPGLKGVFIEALDSGKPVLAVVHRKLRDPEITKRIPRVVEVTVENREWMPRKIVEELMRGMRWGNPHFPR